MPTDIIQKISSSNFSNISAHVWSNPTVGTESLSFLSQTYASGLETSYTDKFDDKDIVYKIGDNLYLNGNPVLLNTVFDNLRVSSNAVKTQGASNLPDFSKFIDNGASSNGVYTYLFDPTTMEQVFFNVQFPHSCKYYAEVSPHVHCAPMTSGTGYMKWGLEYSFANIDGFFSLSNLIYGSGLATGYKKHQLIELPDILSNSISGVSSMLMCRLFRDATGDDYAGDVAFLEFDIHYEMDTLGSNSEYIK